MIVVLCIDPPDKGSINTVKSGYSLGIDIGTTKVAVAIVDTRRLSCLSRFLGKGRIDLSQGRQGTNQKRSSIELGESIPGMIISLSLDTTVSGVLPSTLILGIRTVTPVSVF